MPKSFPYKLTVEDFTVDGLHYSIAITPQLCSGGGNWGKDANDGFDGGLDFTGAYEVLMISERFGTLLFMVSGFFEDRISEIVPDGVTMELIRIIKKINNNDTSGLSFYKGFSKEIYEYLKEIGVTHINVEIEKDVVENEYEITMSEFSVIAYKIKDKENVPDGYQPIGSEYVIDMVEGINEMKFYLEFDEEEFTSFYYGQKVKVSKNSL